MSMTVKVVLGLDPSLKATGWAVWRGLDLVAHGVCRPRQRDAALFRRQWILDTLTDGVLAAYLPDILVVERVPSLEGRQDYRLRSFVADLGDWGRDAGLRVVEVTPSQWRATICGNGGLDKSSALAELRVRYQEMAGLQEAGPDELEAVGIGEYEARRLARPILAAWDDARRRE